MNILHIDCSPRLESHSRALSAALVARLREAYPGATVTRRDVGAAPIPHLQEEYVDRVLALALQPHPATRLSDQLIDEVQRADCLVIGTPMSNLTLPSVFKAWLDQVLRIGRTLGRDADGQKVGLLRDRPVYVAIASGSVFSGERAQQPDFLTPYLSAALASAGLRSVRFLALQGTARLDASQLRVAQQHVLARFEEHLKGDFS